MGTVCIYWPKTAVQTVPSGCCLAKLACAEFYGFLDDKETVTELKSYSIFGNFFSSDFASFYRIVLCSETSYHFQQHHLELCCG